MAERTMRLVLTEVFPPRIGGSGRWLAELYARCDVGPLRVATDRHCDALPWDASYPLPIDRGPLHFDDWGLTLPINWWQYGRSLAWLYGLVRRWGVGYVHCARAIPEGLLALGLQRLTGVDYLLHAHGEEWHTYKTSRQLDRLADRVVGSADRIIANSEHTHARLLERESCRRTRIDVLPPGVDVQRYTPAVRDRVSAGLSGWSDRPVVLSSGRLVARKGHCHLLTAIERVRRTVGDVLCVIVGDGPERGALDQRINALQLADHVQLLGAVEDATLLSMYQQCDVYASLNVTVSGEYEGFGIVMLEAQACGRPVLVGRSGGTVETCADGVGGYLVDGHDIAQVSDRLIGLLTDRSLADAMGLAARRWVVSHYSWPVLIERAGALLDWCSVDPGPV